MQDYIQVSYLGLGDTDIKVLESMFTLVPELKENYKFSSFDKSHSANVIVINADDPATVIKWNEISSLLGNIAGTIMLSNSGDSISGSITLKRPLRIRRLVDALEAITRDRSIFTNPDEISEIAGGKLRMLVVDDSYPVRKYMENKLAELINMPFHLSFAASGEEAMAKHAGDYYDMIFLDVVMPVIDGYTVCKAIKKARNTYIVMLTSKKSPFDKIRGTMSGCDAYITKPPSDQRLNEEIQMCIKFRLKEREKRNKRASQSPA